MTDNPSEPSQDSPALYEPGLYEEAIAWLYNRIDYEKIAKPKTRYRFTLDRMEELIRRLGHGKHLFREGQMVSENAQSAPRIIHLAGTKGKGSVATMIAQQLQAQGRRVGLYTSPHVNRLEERFRVDGQPASDRQMVGLIEATRAVAQAMSEEPIGAPSFFELTTAIAIEHFHRCGCDDWVLETGLGGRLDSTNVFQSDLTVVTTIGLDHQHVLGNTLAEIAAEKAGIFKPGVPAISGVVSEPARSVIRETARRTGAPLLELDRDFEVTPETTSIQDTGRHAWGSSFRFRGLQGEELAAVHESVVNLGLEGTHQVANAALSIAAMALLAKDDASSSLSRSTQAIDPSAQATLISRSLDSLRSIPLIARVERFELSDGRFAILDAAHNPDSIAALIRTLKRRFGNEKWTIIFGTSVDKDAAAMIQQLLPCTERLILTQYKGNPRYVKTAALAGLAREMGFTESSITLKPDPIDACDWAVEQSSVNDLIVVCGSFFLAAEVRPWLVGKRKSSS